MNDIPLDDPDRLKAARLLDEVMFGDHSNDSANAVIAQALKDARSESSVQAGQFTAKPPYCGQCEWDGIKLVARCFLCRRDAR